MSYVWTALVGLLVGLIAKFLMPGKDPGGIIITMLLGLAGAFVARYVGKAAGLYQPSETPGLIASVLGAMALLLIYRLVRGRRAA